MERATLFLISNPLFNSIGDAMPFYKSDLSEDVSSAVYETTEAVSSFASSLPWIGRLVSRPANQSIERTDELAVQARLLRRAKNNTLFGLLGIYLFSLFYPSINKRLAWVSMAEFAALHVLPGVFVWADVYRNPSRDVREDSSSL